MANEACAWFGSNHDPQRVAFWQANEAHNRPIPKFVHQSLTFLRASPEGRLAPVQERVRRILLRCEALPGEKWMAMVCPGNQWQTAVHFGTKQTLNQIRHALHSIEMTLDAADLHLGQHDRSPVVVCNETIRHLAAPH
jgi:hypothetical protein